MKTDQNMNLFRELLNCGDNISTWCYHADGVLLSSNCGEESLFASAFSTLGCKDRMLSHAAKHRNPIRLGAAMGLVWGAAYEWEADRLYRAHVIGPVFFTEISKSEIETGLAAYKNLELSIAWKKHFLEALDQIPTVPTIVFSRYLLMLHYCLTGEHLSASDLDYRTLAPVSGEMTQAGEVSSGAAARDRHKVWMAERAMLQMVRSGDLNYKAVLNNSMLISNGVPVHGKDPLSQGKISGIVFCSIVCRAAIQGGLTPAEAYSLGDSYIQSCESAKSLDELTAIPGIMYDDFIRRVHKRRTSPRLSPPVQKCVDYIELHPGERIRARDLAALAGYSEYYLTRKFKDETRCSVNEYIKFARIERAKLLLSCTDEGIQEIAEQLGFSTRSHFSQSFKQVTGQSPADYRSSCPDC